MPPRTVETIDPLECYVLLRRSYVGRLAYVRGGRAHVVPVNYRLDDACRIVVRSTAGEKLEAARRGDVLSLQVDGIDDLYHDGWSVLASGPAEEVADPVEIAALAGLLLRPWSPDAAAGSWIRIRPDRVEGRRLGPGTGGPDGTCPSALVPPRSPDVHWEHTRGAAPGGVTP